MYVWSRWDPKIDHFLCTILRIRTQTSIMNGNTWVWDSSLSIHPQLHSYRNRQYIWNIVGFMILNNANNWYVAYWYIKNPNLRKLFIDTIIMPSVRWCLGVDDENRTSTVEPSPTPQNWLKCLLCFAFSLKRFRFKT